jgi:hypothetical protein
LPRQAHFVGYKHQGEDAYTRTKHKTLRLRFCYGRPPPQTCSNTDPRPGTDAVPFDCAGYLNGTTGTRPRYSALLCSALRHSILFYSALLCSALLYATLLYSTLRYSALLYATLLCSALLHSTLRHAMPCHAILYYASLRCAATSLLLLRYITPSIVEFDPARSFCSIFLSAFCVHFCSSSAF